MFLQKRRTASKGRCLSGGAFTTTTLCLRSVFAYLLCVLFLSSWNLSSCRQLSKGLAANVILLRRSVFLIDSPKLKLEHPTEIQTLVRHLRCFFWFAQLFTRILQLHMNIRFSLWFANWLCVVLCG